jgi:predicted nucleic acid-binding protein
MLSSIPTEALLDVNILIASVFVDHMAHERARPFVESLAKFVTTPTTQGGFLRFASRPWKNERGEEQPPRLTMTGAVEKLQFIAKSANHVFLPDDQPFIDLETRFLQGHRQWTDAYLLHCARSNGLALATLDGRMAALDDPKHPVLFVLP